MRYKAYDADINKKTPSTEPILIDQDDDLMVLQKRLREKGIEFVKRIRIIDTFYEDKFNENRKAIENNNREYIREDIKNSVEVFAQNIPVMKRYIAFTLSNSPIVGANIAPDQIYVTETEVDSKKIITVDLTFLNLGKLEFII